MPAADSQHPAYIDQRAEDTTAELASQQKSPDVVKGVARSDAPVLVELKEANIGYKDRKVLKNVDWTIREGDRIALTGANGESASFEQVCRLLMYGTLQALASRHFCL